MREDMLSEKLVRVSKNSDQASALKNNAKATANQSKPRFHSSWGSQIVKGFTTDKKSKLQLVIPINNKKPSACPEAQNSKNQLQQQSRVKRSLIGDLACPSNASQVHPHAFDCQRTRSPSSHNLFFELDHLRSLLHDSKERELVLQNELQHYKENPKVKELERELDAKRRDLENLVYKVGALEAEKASLSEQVSSLLEHRDETPSSNEEVPSQKSLEMEVVELRRLNKELQFQKRNLALQLSSAELQLASLKNVTESDIVAKAEAEALLLRHTNEDLCKQVEGLQMSRLNEVEELAYLRWINSCLRQELQNSDCQSRVASPVDADKISSQAFPKTKKSLEPKSLTGGLNKSLSVEFDGGKNAGFGKKTFRFPKIDEECQVIPCEDILDKEWMEASEGRSPRRRHSISGPKGGCTEEWKLNKRRQSDGFIFPRDLDNSACINERYPPAKGRLQMLVEKYDFGAAQSPRFSVNRMESTKSASLDVEKRALRIPNPPPRPSNSAPISAKTEGSAPVPVPPPPPPPPPPKMSMRNTNMVQRAPQVVELYHSLMKRDSKKESSSNGGICEAPDVADVRSSMIGEIANRSSHLLAIKADVETQGDFVRSLIKEVNDAVYRDIDDVVAFVKWLDDELSFLVDERAVLKHFDWPEKKADALREAAFGYRDLKKLEAEASYFDDNPRLPSDVALKKMTALFEKMERGVYNLLRTRDGLIRHYKEFQIPTDWMLDTGIICKIKFASVKLAKKYMKRVALELQGMDASDKDPALDYMLLQGVRFAFRVHQFAGGFDSETMHAFEELRNLALDRNKN